MTRNITSPDDAPDEARRLLSRLHRDNFPTPFHFQPWGPQNQNGDDRESVLTDQTGDTLAYELPDAVGELAAAAPELVKIVANSYTEWAVQGPAGSIICLEDHDTEAEEVGRPHWTTNRACAEARMTRMQGIFPGQTYYLVHRFITEPMREQD